jgi:putative ABC transport system ATP-binding protein
MLVHAEGMTKTYHLGGSEVAALRGVDVDVAPGEFVALMGPSGSGKSTLMHLLGCLDRPDAGRYRLDGQAVEALGDAELSRLRNTRIGFIFQAFNLIPQHNVLENVELPLVYGGVPPRIRRDKSLAILGQVGLGAKVEHRPTQLSGGEAQRVAVARALAIDPILLLADEPTGNLDTRTGDSIMELFVDLNRRGTTIVMVTHNEAVAGYAGRLIEMRDGVIIRDTEPRAAASVTAS